MSDSRVERMAHPPEDISVLKQLYDMAETWDLAQLERFCAGTMNALVVVQQVFRNRFPAEHTAWEASDFFNGDILTRLSDG